MTGSEASAGANAPRRHTRLPAETASSISGRASRIWSSAVGTVRWATDFTGQACGPMLYAGWARLPVGHFPRLQQAIQTRPLWAHT